MSDNFSNSFFSVSFAEPWLVVFELSDKESSDVEFNEFIHWHQKVIDHQSNLCLIYKASKVKYISASHRIKIGQWTKNNVEAIKSKIPGVAYCINSSMAKLILNGIFLVQKPVYPYEIFSDEAKALEWLNGKRLAFQASK